MSRTSLRSICVFSFLVFTFISGCTTVGPAWQSIPESDRAVILQTSITQLIAAGMRSAGVKVEGSTSGPAICTTADPRPDLWPRAPFAGGKESDYLRPGTIAALEHDGLHGQDLGSLRLGASGCWEILAHLNGHMWEPYDPANVLHANMANVFSRIGQGWSGGHTSDDSFYFVSHAADLGETVVWGSMRFVDLEYSRALRADLDRRWCETQPKPKPAVCGETPSTPPTIPPTTPVQPSTPLVPPIAAVCPVGQECHPPCPTCPTCAICVDCPKPITVPADVLETLRLAPSLVGKKYQARLKAALKWAESVNSEHK